LALFSAPVKKIKQWRLQFKEIKMKYKVHKLEIKMETDQGKLEQFLNNLKGEVVSILPNNKRMSLFQIYGVTAKIDFLFIVEKIK